MQKRTLLMFLGSVALSSAMPRTSNAQQYYCAFTVDVSCTGGANSTLFGGLSVTGGSLTFDGVDDYLQFNQHLVPTSGAVTVSFWARVTSELPGAAQEFVSQGVPGAGGFRMGLTTNSTIRIPGNLQTGLTVPNDHAWHHFAFGTNGVDLFDVWFDGVLTGSLSQALLSGAGGTDTRLGRLFDGAGPDFFNGQLNDFGVYNTLLSNEQVAALASNRSTIPSTVPEPSTVLLLGSGLAALAFGARRRHSRLSHVA